MRNIISFSSINCAVLCCTLGAFTVATLIPFQVVASSVEMHQQSQETQIPKPISLNRFQTLNGFGFIFLTPSPMLLDFLESESHPEAILIEVGAGFGNTPIEALKRNVGTYIANDISQEHLNILRARALQAGETDKNIDLNNSPYAPLGMVQIMVILLCRPFRTP